MASLLLQIRAEIFRKRVPIDLEGYNTCPVAMTDVLLKSKRTNGFTRNYWTSDQLQFF
uniref:Uncharacterized protein n=1 Tax=Arundo donax TaxID=35708 RepID=A0A0A9DZY1_ARUDO